MFLVRMAKSRGVDSRVEGSYEQEDGEDGCSYAECGENGNNDGVGGNLLPVSNDVSKEVRLPYTR